MAGTECQMLWGLGTVNPWYKVLFLPRSPWMELSFYLHALLCPSLFFLIIVIWVTNFCHCSTFLVYLGWLFFDKKFLRYLSKKETISKNILRIQEEKLNMLLSVVFFSLSWTVNWNKKYHVLFSANVLFFRLIPWKQWVMSKLCI